MNRELSKVKKEKSAQSNRELTLDNFIGLYRSPPMGNIKNLSHVLIPLIDIASLFIDMPGPFRNKNS
jgi:hypothetical protein